MKETRIEIRKKCEGGVVNIVDNDNNPIGSQTVESGEVETFVVTDLPCGDGFAEVKKSDGTTITTITVPRGTAVPYNVADSIIDIDGMQWSVMATDSLGLSVVDTIGEIADTTKVGNDIVIEDRQYNIYVNGVLNQTFTAPAVDDLTININA